MTTAKADAFDAVPATGGSAPVETLTGLVDHSLVRVEPDHRYSLHELIRQYAADRLAAS